MWRLMGRLRRGFSLDSKFNVCKDPKIAGQNFDLAVIGGGSGGVAAANTAASLGMKVALLDYVVPTPSGTTWGVGGTCVNVGCIPKKLYHHASVSHWDLKNLPELGFQGVESPSVDWPTLRKSIQMHVKRTSYGIRSNLLDAGVTYVNSLGSLQSPNTILFSPDPEALRKSLNGSVHPETTGTFNAKYIILAAGGRPVRPSESEIPGAKYMITSDDLFSLQNAPGRTLIVGAGYIGVESASFLQLLGYQSTIVARSQLLRGFDRGSISVLEDYLNKLGLDIAKEAAVKEIVPHPSGSGYLVTVVSAKDKSRQLEGRPDLVSAHFDTVIAAVSRRPETALLNLVPLGIKTDSGSGKVLADINSGEPDLTHHKNIYAIGDILHGAPELTPTAIKSGISVAKKIAKKLKSEPISSRDSVSFDTIPTTVFSFPEFSTCGLSEESARKQYGDDNVAVHHVVTTPLEEELVMHPFPSDEHNDAKIKSYFKVVSLRENGKIVGLHFVGRHAGEVIQGYALAMTYGLTLQQLHNSVGIHPTIAEDFGSTVFEKQGADDTELPEKTSC